MIHDFRKEIWGHGMTLTERVKKKSEWTFVSQRLGVDVGDIILRDMSSGQVGQFKVESINYFKTPKDMFNARVSWVGYIEDEEVEKLLRKQRMREGS